MLPLWDNTPRRRAPVMTMLLIAANVAVFVYELMLTAQGGRGLEAFILEHALVPNRLLADWTQGEAWLTVCTAMFLHGGVAHVAGNCWYLWVFGQHVEDRLGPVVFAFFYLVSGVGAAALQVAMEIGSAVPMLGASGAISGVMGAYLLLSPGAWVVTLVPWVVPVVPLPAFLLLLAWFATQALNGVGTLLAAGPAQGGVAWWAHAGGFMTGFLLAWRLRRAGRVRRRRTV